MSSRIEQQSNAAMSFVRFLFGAFVVFFVLVFALVGLHMLNGSNFVSAWRWVHDALLISIFWYIAPIFLLAFLIDIAFEKYKKFEWLHSLPVFIHQLVVIFFALGTASLLSQLLGGCIWFLPTEGWWSRFRPLGISEIQAIMFYVVTTPIGVWATYAYWKRFVFQKQ